MSADLHCEPWLRPAVDRLGAIVADGDLGVGGQLWVSHRGEVVCDVGVGDAVEGPMTPGTVHNHYCAGKPFTAVAVACLVADGALDPTAPLASLGLPAWAVPPFDCTTLDLLDHQAGLDGMPGVEYRLIPTEFRAEQISGRIAAAERRPAYSEILGGAILEQVIAASAPGETAVEVIRRLVLDPLGLGAVALDEASALPLIDARLMSVGFGGLPDDRVPMLAEIVQSVPNLRPAFGVVCSSRDLGVLIEECRRSLDPSTVDPVLPREALSMFLARRHPTFEDQHVQRTVHLAGGFMVDVVANEMAQLASTNSFGHSGAGDTMSAFADIDHELTVAMYLNGLEPGQPHGRDDRLAVIDEVYRCLFRR